MSSSPAARVSDAERDLVIGQLKAAYSEGRLDKNEFQDRTRKALTARLRGDLDILVADIPQGSAASGAPASGPRQRSLLRACVDCVGDACRAVCHLFSALAGAGQRGDER